PGVEHLPDGVDLRVGYDRRQVPAVAENPGHAVALHDFDVARLVDRMTNKEIPGKHRLLNETPGTLAPRPDRNHRQKRVEPLRDQLIMDELLAVTVRPQSQPLFFDCQGFAPFG